MRLQLQTDDRRTPSWGFSLVETLVVIGVVGVLLGLLMPALRSIRADSHSTTCLTNLREIHAAVEIMRQQNNDLLPYAAPLPLPAEQVGDVPGLPERLERIVPRDSSTWMCPADDTQDSEDLGTSYVYLPGAFMLVLPPPIPDPPWTQKALIDRAMRVITQRYINGYLQSVPLVCDSGDYHAYGRHPRNVLFLGGEARVGRPEDENIAPPQR